MNILLEKEFGKENYHDLLHFKKLTKTVISKTLYGFFKNERKKIVFYIFMFNYSLLFLNVTYKKS
jgi:hypothetical protein